MPGHWNSLPAHSPSNYDWMPFVDAWEGVKVGEKRQIATFAFVGAGERVGTAPERVGTALGVDGTKEVGCHRANLVGIIS